MNQVYRIFTFAAAMVLLVSLVHAAPVSLGGPVVGVGDGLNSRWVNTSYSPHNVDQALNALALGPGDAGYVGEVIQIVEQIDFADSNWNGYVHGYDADPLSPDGNFAVGYSGYINISTEDLYTFRAYTDDGFRLTIGGEMVSQHFGDRGPGTTDGSVFLQAGFYEFMMVGWEQGGVFVNELSWRNSPSDTWSLVDSTVLFSSNPLGDPSAVPEPSTVALFGLGVTGIFLTRRKLAK